jgi:hypothetical protein
MLSRGLVTFVISILAALGTVAISAPAQAQSATTASASCWVNVFAWVSTSPSMQGNLSSTVSCNPTVQKITLTMIVHNVSDGAVVATVGPVDQFNTTSAGIKYTWYCNQSFPRNLYGEVHGSVTEYGGAVSTGAWSTQSLGC